MEFTKLLNSREITHLVLGRNKPDVCLGFSLVVAALAAVFTAWLWYPDPLQPRDVASGDTFFGLNCNNLPSSADLNAACDAADRALATYKKSFDGAPKNLDVDFDALVTQAANSEPAATPPVPSPRSGERKSRTKKASPPPAPASVSASGAESVSATASASSNMQTFLTRGICAPVHKGPFADLSPGQMRFLYFLVANNKGHVCADRKLTARSRLVRWLGWTAGGWACALANLLVVLAAAGLIFMTWQTRNAYLWLYGSRHVKNTG